MNTTSTSNNGKHKTFATSIRQVLLRFFDATLSYLPLILMVCLAIGSYSLMKATQPKTASESPVKTPHVIDYFLQNFAIRHFANNGHLQYLLQGETAQHDADTQYLFTHQAHLQEFESNGGIRTTSQANQAVSNPTHTEIRLSDGDDATRPVHVVQHAFTDVNGFVQLERTFTGSALVLFPKDKHIRSDKPVLVKQGLNQFTADNMVYDHNTRVLQLQGNVSVVYQVKN